jgi:hypothetical protein
MCEPATDVLLRRDRGFESGPVQRRVSCELKSFRGVGGAQQKTECQRDLLPCSAYRAASTSADHGLRVRRHGGDVAAVWRESTKPLRDHGSDLRDADEPSISDFGRPGANPTQKNSGGGNRRFEEGQSWIGGIGSACSRLIGLASLRIDPNQTPREAWILDRASGRLPSSAAYSASVPSPITRSEIAMLSYRRLSPLVISATSDRLKESC